MHARRLFALIAAAGAAHAGAQTDIIAGAEPEPLATQIISLDAPGGAFTHDDQAAGDVLAIPRDATATFVRFWGGQETGALDENTLGFRVRIYNVDTSNGALSLVREERHAQAFAAPTETGTTFGAQQAPMTRYELPLWSELPLDGGASYLVAVTAVTLVEPIETREAWTLASAPGDGVIMLDLMDGNSWQPATGLAPGLAIQLVGEIAPPPCLADVNEDGALTPADFTAWISAYNTGDSRADQNEDGLLTPADFTAWIGNYNAGC